MIQRLHLKPLGSASASRVMSFRHSYCGLLDETGADAGMQKGPMGHAAHLMRELQRPEPINVFTFRMFHNHIDDMSCERDRCCSRG